MLPENSTIHPKPNTTIAYTDGACKGNPGSGGWGAYFIFDDGTTQELYAGEADTTNNRMEMLGAIHAILYSPIEHSLELWTDSSYVKDGITKWMAGWKKNGWKTSQKKPVKNQDLWEKLDEVTQNRNIDWHWIKGHAGHEGNEKADDLANQGVVNPLGNLATISKKQITRQASEEQATKEQKKTADDWMMSDILGFDDDVEDDEFHDTSIDEANIYEANVDEGNVYEANVNESNIDRSNDDEANIDENNTEEISITDINSQKKELHKPTERSHHISHDISNNVVTDLPVFDGDTSRANPNFQALLPNPINKGKNNRQLIMDTETTGFDFNNGDRIVEVGIIEMVGRKFTGEKLHVYINPSRKEPMSEEVIRVHGITDAFLADKPTFNSVAKQIFDFMAGAEIIAHNATFDMNFLNMEFQKAKLPKLSDHAKVTDSLAIAKKQYPGQRNSLDALVRRLNVGKQERTFHGALLDSEILAEVYLAMTGGQVSLAIDEDSDEDGVTHHQKFAKLANMIVIDKADFSAHTDWLNTISQKNPEVTKVWSV